MNARLLSVAVLPLFLVPSAFSQSQTPAAAPAVPPSPSAQHQHVQPRHDDRHDEARGQEMSRGEMRGPEDHMMAEGTWWRNPEVVSRIGLTTEQTKHIDDIFLQSRVQLIDLHASLDKEELLMEPLMNANPVDQTKALAQIGKIADTRAELEKTNAKMLLSIRGVLNADQWTKLRAGRPHGGEMHGGPDGQHRPGGPMGRGPGGQQGPPPQPE
jgi:Spy/CpxP family protein refolding chaperone